MAERLDENQVKESYDKKLALFNRLFKNRLTMLTRAIQSKREIMDVPTLLGEYLDDFKFKITKLLPDKIDELLQALDALKVDLHNIAADEQIAYVAEILSKFLAKNISLADFEKFSRQGPDLVTSLDSSRSTILNRLLVYRLDGDTIILDIPITFIEKPSEFKILFIDGMKKIAKLLQEDVDLRGAVRIIGYSWIIFESPEIVKKLGFTIVSINPDLGTGLAEISKEKLIELYGN